MAENDKKTGAKAKTGNAFTRFFKNAGKFLRDCKGEMNKIVWPTTEATFRNTGVVLVVVTVVCLFVFGLDTLFMTLLSNLMNVAA